MFTLILFFISLGCFILCFVLYKKSSNYSYKLSIIIEPNWRYIFEKYASKNTSDDFIKLLEKQEKEDDGGMFCNILGRKYQFIEYYNSKPGSIMRFQETLLFGDRSIFSSVNSFGDHETLLDINNNKLIHIEIGDNYILPQPQGSTALGINFGGATTEDFLLLFPLKEFLDYSLQKNNKSREKLEINFKNKIKELSFEKDKNASNSFIHKNGHRITINFQLFNERESRWHNRFTKTQYTPGTFLKDYK